MTGFEGFGYLVLATLLDTAILTILIRRSSRQRFQGWAESIAVAFFSSLAMFYASCWANGSGTYALQIFLVGLCLVAIFFDSAAQIRHIFNKLGSGAHRTFVRHGKTRPACIILSQA